MPLYLLALLLQICDLPLQASHLMCPVYVAHRDDTPRDLRSRLVPCRVSISVATVAARARVESTATDVVPPVAKTTAFRGVVLAVERCDEAFPDGLPQEALPRSAVLPGHEAARSGVFKHTRLASLIKSGGDPLAIKPDE